MDTGICSDTKNDGTYELPVTIGTKVSMRVEYLNDTINTVSRNKDFCLMFCNYLYHFAVSTVILQFRMIFKLS